MEKFYLLKTHIPVVPAIRIASILFLFLCPAGVSGQTTNISGVVNTYHKVIQIIPSKACLRVADITGLDVNSTVMIVQMKGATINTGNNSSYGDTTSLNKAGSYEIGVVCFIIGDSVFLFHNLLNTYDSAAKVQIVQFGDYYSANVIDTVKAVPWDSATGKGGVIAIYAEQDLTLNAPIYADTSGYKGGKYFNNDGSCPVGTGWVYNPANSFANGGYKGEGVAAIAAGADGAKGAPANAGGGGNNHNNSGGGGANLVAGGNGGGNSSNGPFGCNTGNNWGRAGKAMGSWSGTKIFMGGGGGAGHSNNGNINLNYGGKGGGLIFIWANNLVGNNKIISANGGVGGASTSDGAGGGGAGGTIIMNVTTYSGGLTINSKGGNGGLSDDGGVVGRCFGGGGGGSGGAVYFSGSVPPITVAVDGGAAGAEIGRDGTCNAAVPGAPGNTGTIFSSYSFSRSTDPAGYCRFLLPSQLISFKVRMVNRNILSEWRVLNPETVKDFTLEKRTGNGDWSKVNTIPAFGINENYSSIDDHPLPGINYYRLKIVERSNLVYYSEVRKVFVDMNDPGFTIYPNPASDRFFISGNINLPASLVLMDISGRVIWEKRVLNIHSVCMLPKLPPGIYLLQCEQAIRKLVLR